MSIIATILLGFFVGIFARMLVPGRNAIGCVLTILLGICGAAVGKVLGEQLGFYAKDESVGFFMSLVGAMLLLYLHNLFTRRS